MKLPTVALLVALGWAAVGQGGTHHDKPADTARFVLGVNQDESLTLDGKAVTRDQLAKEWPRLAEQVREKARAAGVTLDPEQTLPAVIIIWAADETPYSLVYALSLEAQKSGFRNWVFLPRSLHPDPPLIPPPDRSAVSGEPSGLHEVLRTLPIRLRADKQGNIDRVTLAEVELPDFKALRFELSQIQDDPDTPFDRAVLRIDPTLMFSEMVRVTDLLAKYRIRAIHLVETSPGNDN